MNSTSSRTIRTANQLVSEGLRTAEQAAVLSDVLDRYALGISPAMSALIRAEGGDGPITRQFMPDRAELHTAPEEQPDPIGDAPHSPVKGIVHRYPDRVLFKPVHQCAVYCRFCFRREQVGPGKDALSATEWAAALDYIRNNPGIREVILSGGDPLILSARRLRELYQALLEIPHVRMIRIHTRVPVVAPDYVSDDLVAALCGPKPVYIAIHTNHADEWTEAARTATRRLANAGFPLLSQTVLLKGINDTVSALEDLLWVLLEQRVRPYYLHHGDLAPGTRHFRTSIAAGRALMAELRQRNSGLSLPTYMLDVPGGFGKTELTSDFVTETSPGLWRVITRCGHDMVYQDHSAPSD